MFCANRNRFCFILDHSKLKMQDPEQYESIITNHPAIINELTRRSIPGSIADNESYRNDQQ